jgi:serine O-acetyltransferase
MKPDFVTWLAYTTKRSLIGKLAYLALKIWGIEFPRPVPIGSDLEFAHGGFGIVIHSKAQIGNRVKIYPGVTLGRADIYKPATESRFEGISIEDDVILSPGCKVLCKTGMLKVGRGTVIGANAVLLESTGNWEIWAGVPARKVGERDHQAFSLNHPDDAEHRA